MKAPRLAAIAAAIALLALALALAACGEKSEDTSSETEPVSLTLDFYPNPDHAGIYMAQKLGYFEEAGLDVCIDSPADPAAPLKLVAAGRSDLAISYEPEVALAHETGPRRGRHRGARQPAADLDDLAAEIRDQRRRRPEREDRRLRRHPLPGGLPEDDPRPRPADARGRQGGQRRLRPAPRAGRRQRPGDARRLQQRRGRRPARTRQRTGGHSRSTSSASRPTTSSSSSPAARSWKKTRKSTASSSPPWNAAPKRPWRSRKPRPKRSSKPTTGSNRN